MTGERQYGHGAGELTARLVRERRSLAIRLWLAVLFAAGAVAALVFTSGVLLFDNGRWLELPRALPLLTLFSAFVAAAAVAWKFYSQYRRHLSHVEIASVAEHEQALRAGSLRGAIEVGDSGALGAYAASQVASRLRSARVLTPALMRSFSKLSFHAGSVAVVAAAAFGITAVNAADGFAALVHPVDAWRGLLLPPLGFSNEVKDVPRGMPYTLRISAPGRTRLRVTSRVAGEADRDTVIQVDPMTALASLPLGPVTAPISVTVSDGRSVPLALVITVADRGWIGDVVLHAEYPSYLHRADERLEALPSLRVPQGTRVRIRAMLRGGARDAVLTNGRDSIQLDADTAGGYVSGAIFAMEDGRWGWLSSPAFNNATGRILPVEVPDPLELLVSPDAPPAVMITSPRRDSVTGALGAVPVHVQASDDHGLSAIHLEYWKSGSSRGSGAGGQRTRVLLGASDIGLWEGGTTLVLDELKLEPGDRVHIVAVATDDSPWKQQTYSTESILRVPSLSEQRNLARSLADSLAQRAEEMARDGRELQQRTADASRSRDLKSDRDGGNDGTDAGRNPMSYQTAERVRELGNLQEQMGARVDSLRRQTRDLEDRLRNAGALDSEMQNRMREIQNMLRDAMTSEMQQQLQELQRSLDRLSGTEAGRTLEQLMQQQQQMREQLEKSAEMLKRAALEGAMQTLSDEARDLAQEQKEVASQLRSNGKDPSDAPDPRTLAERTRSLEREVEQLAKRLDEAGAKAGADGARAARPDASRSADAMQRAVEEAARSAERSTRTSDSGSDSTNRASTDKGAGQKDISGADATSAQRNDTRGAQDASRQGQQGAQQRMAGRDGQQSQGGSATPRPNPEAARHADDASGAMERAAKRLSDARDAQVNAWKDDLSQQLDRSINETQQLARQQAELEQRLTRDGASAVRGDQAAVQQGVRQAAERLEQAGRSSSLLSQRSQKAMGEAERKVQDATKALSDAQQGMGQQGAQNAMREATDALNQALSSLVRDRERVNNAQSASGFTEMMEQLRQLAQQQNALNGQMQGLSMLPGGMQGQQAQQQSRVLARQQRDVARSLRDVSDADATGRTDALAREAQQIAQAMERQGLDPSIAARQQQLYRRLLDAGRFLEQDERDDQGPREARAGSGEGAGTVEGTANGKSASRYPPPAWSDLRGLGAEERRLVIQYFRRINGGNP